MQNRQHPGRAKDVDDKRNIIVATHPRSGTHLCINAFRMNVHDSRFPMIRRQYPSIERLVMGHDAAYTKEWEEYVFGGAPGGIRLFKTHMSRADIEAALENTDILNGTERRLFAHIVASSRFVYVHRDGRDTLVSWFHYMRDFGGHLPADLPPRIAHCDLSEFIRMPNRFFAPVRGIEPVDVNRAAYWRHHVESWLNDAQTIPVAYEALSRDFNATFSKLADAVGVSDQMYQKLCRPPLIPAPRGNYAGRVLSAIRKRVLVQGYTLRDRIVRKVPGKVPLSAHARKGRIGGWRSRFSTGDLAFFDAQAGAVMRRLGYTA
jgi:hypothetical protein